VRPREVVNAARRVVEVLGDVIDAPIADAGVLRKARKLFSKLTMIPERRMIVSGIEDDRLRGTRCRPHSEVEWLSRAALRPPPQ